MWGCKTKPKFKVWGIPKVLPALQALKDMGISKMAIATNGFPGFLWNQMEEFELFQFFTKDDVFGRLGPDETADKKEIFTAAVNHIGGGMSDTLIFDDGARYCRIAKKTFPDSLVVYLETEGKDEECPEADFTIGCISELPPLVEKINAAA
ncbi:MAG: HAD family hydrolase [Proteobacteria bacterium]|nr:HAD family hydrolase [Pseudomonadota bacterium]